MVESRPANIDQALQDRNLSTLRTKLLVPIARDLSAVFVDQFRVTDYQKIAQATTDLELNTIPGQAFIRTFKAALKLRDTNQDVKTFQTKYGVNKNDWRILLPLGCAGLIMGVINEIAEGGGGSKTGEAKPFISLYPNVIVSLASTLSSSEKFIATVGLLSALKVLTVPYAAFHEMSHTLRDKEFGDKYGSRLHETWTDLWVRVVATHGTSLISRIAYRYATTPATAYLNWPPFDRGLVHAFIHNIELQSELPRVEILQAMAQLYCGKSERLLDIVYDLSGGRETDILKLFNNAKSQVTKVQQMYSLFNQNHAHHPIPRV